MSTRPNIATNAQIIGPIAPSVGGIIYQVTLESGMIVTNPGDFADDHLASAFGSAVVTVDGMFLDGFVNETIATDVEDITPFQRFEDFARKLIAVPKLEIDEQAEKPREP